MFNPQHIGGVPSTFCWSPVDGCEDPATAIRRADAFAFAVSQKGVEDGTFWSAKASDYLRGHFHAAALAGYDLRAVAAWVAGADPRIPERILAAASARQWASTLAELRGEAHKTAATVRMGMSRSLGFTATPTSRPASCPHRAPGSNIPAFLAQAGPSTVYMSPKRSPRKRESLRCSRPCRERGAGWSPVSSPRQTGREARAAADRALRSAVVVH